MRNKTKSAIKALIFFQFALFLFSCSTINKIDRNGTDLIITNNNFKNLQGKFLNQNINSNWSLYDLIYGRRMFYKKLKSDTALVYVNPIDQKRIELAFILNKDTLRTKKLKGEIQDGYFIVRPTFG